MSKSILLSVGLVLLLAGCGGKDDASAESKASLGDAIIAVSKLDDVADASKSMEKHLEELKKLTPISNEQLKSALPETLGDIARSSFEINNAMGFHLAEAKYEKDAHNFNLQITDGAGEMGASMVAMVEMASAMNAESESQTGYTKQFSIGGAKGSEKQDKTDANNVTNELTLVVANRYVLVVKSSVGDMDTLKTIVKDSKVIDKLESLK